MKTLLLFIFVLPSFFVSENLYAQTGRTILRMEESKQVCLDSGTYMLGCAKRFYFQMDSLLNVVYFQLRSKSDSLQKSLLKKEQKLWLVKRNAFFKKTLGEFKKKNPGRSEDTAQDDAMFMYEDNAEFVKDRILNIMGRLGR